MKKTLKVCGIAILTPLVLFLLLAALFYFPPFQTWVVGNVTAVASEKTGMQISVKNVRLSFPLNLAVHEAVVCQADSIVEGKTDTIASINKTIVDVELLPLFGGVANINQLDIDGVKFNTHDLVATMKMHGELKKLSLKSRGIDFSKEQVVLNEALIDGVKADIIMLDTVVEDTSATENHWKINLKSLTLRNTDVAFHMPGDTLSVVAQGVSAKAKRGSFDLEKGFYAVGSADVACRQLQYNMNYEPRTVGFDYNHLFFNDMSVGVDSVSYCAPDMYLKLRKVAFKEQSGIALTSLSGVVKIDSTALHIPSLKLLTPNSDMSLGMNMDLNAFDDVNPGQMTLNTSGNIGKGDLLPFMSALPKPLQMAWPHYALKFDAVVNGNSKRMSISRFEAELPTVFRATASGYIEDMLHTDDLYANVNIDANFGNLNTMASAMLPKDLGVRIPSGIALKGGVAFNADGNICTANITASQGGGSVRMNGFYNMDKTSYRADVEANKFPIGGFLPAMKMTPFSGKLNIEGTGVALLSPKTTLEAEAEIGSFRYEDFDLGGTKATASIKNGKVYSNIHCINELLRGDISLDALLSTKRLDATVACSLDRADLYGMHFTDVPLVTSLCAHMDVESDMYENHRLEGAVSDVVIIDSATTYRTQELVVDAQTRPDSTWAKVQSGDFNLDLAVSGGYKNLLALSDNLLNELTRQIERKYISQDSLKQVLPIGHMKIRSGKRNFLNGYATKMGYGFREINADVTSSPTDGLNGYAQIDSLIVSSMQLDKVRLELETDADGFKYNGQVQNYKHNPQVTFNALFRGRLFETGGSLDLLLYDAKDKLGLKMGLHAMLEQNGIRVKLADTDAVLGYRNFKANKDNYIFLADNNRVWANMKLKSDDGMGIQLFSADDNLDALQDITVGIHRLDLASIVGIIPYMPDVKGIMNGDFHVIQTQDELSVSSSLGVDGLVYEGNKMGNMSSEFVYMPLDNDGHYVDGMLTHNGRDIGTIKGTYKTIAGEGVLNAVVDLARLPLNLANGFVPDQIMGLKGYGDGKLNIDGPLSAMNISGEIDLDSAYLVSIPYGVELKFDDRPVYIKDSKLLLDNFNMYSHNERPLVINGNVDFSNLDNMTATMRMTARNFLLVDSKENRRSEVFGKTYVNFDAYMNGPLAALRIYGKLDVLGTTDMTYILRDTPLTTDNKMEELVKFTDFSQTKEEVIVRPPLEGLYMNLDISVAQGARVFCALNAMKTNYLDMIGGGDLRMVYSADELRMTGRYTLNSGEMKYSLPVIPLKTFHIKQGSYVEFTGDVMNPTLNITATEENKTNVNIDGTSRSVNFNCGVEISQTLNNMGLKFIIDAPENNDISSQLQTMSLEERGKLAVTMLTTGMYLSDNNLSSFSMNDALSQFLQSEINNISGSALRTLDLSIGLDNTKDAAGAMHTDYTFKFAKRFWNNRIRIVVGGKVSSGNASAENLFDNIAFEYRLDQNANTNLRLFYDRATYDFLEGYVGQYGVGLVWKRKLQSLSELFPWRKKTVIPAMTNYQNTASDTLNINKEDK